MSEMNLLFWCLIALAAFLTWVLLSAVFIPLGKFSYMRWKRLNDKLNKEYKEEKEKEKHEIR